MLIRENINVINENMEYKLPLVSVIVPIYNVEKYLRRCVDSILKARLS